MIPTSDTGTTRITTIGSIQLSYWADSTRNTRAIERAKMITIVLPTSFSW